jgi:photosystem II stability/assembly factor-like uncharacterized protein
MPVRAFAFEGSNIFAGTIWGMYLSTDSGSSWTTINEGLTAQFVCELALTPTCILAGTTGGVFRSTDGGMHWISSSAGLPTGPVYTMERRDSVLFAGTSSGLFRSGDDALNWVASGTGITSPHIYALAHAGDALFAGTLAGLFRSSDGGDTWEELNTGVLGRSVQSLVFHGSTLFAGASDGVYLSSDMGETWIPVNEGLPRVYVDCLAVGSHDLLLGTLGNAVWRRPLSEFVTSVDPTATVRPQEFALEQNYPNPFNPSTTIHYGLPGRSRVTLSVFNTLGQQVATIVQGEQEAGFHDVQFDASGLASGVYLYRLVAGSFVQTRRLLLLR